MILGPATPAPDRPSATVPRDPAPPVAGKAVRSLTSDLHPRGSGDVAESPPEPATFEGVEVEMFVERRGLVVDGVDHHRPSAELTAAPDATPEGVEEKMTPELPALL